MGTEKKNKLKELIEKGRNVKSAVYAYDNHPLAESENEVKNDYLTFLIAIAAYDGDLSSHETAFLRRIYDGVKTDVDFESLAKNALENLDDKALVDFVTKTLEKSLEQNFIVDAVILSAVDGSINETEIEIIAEFSEMLKIKEKQLDLLSELAVIIIKQDADEFHRIREQFNAEKITLTSFKYLLRDFIDEKFISDEEIFYLTGKVEITDETVVKFKKVIIENAEITLNTDKPFAFINCPEISIVNSKIENVNENYIPIAITAAKNVRMEKLAFGNFKPNRGIIFNDCDNVLITSSDFYDCGYGFYHSSDNNIDGKGGALAYELYHSFDNNIDNSSGGLFKFLSCKTVSISFSTFRDISISTKDYNPAFGAILSASYSQINLKDITLNKCWAKNNKEEFPMFVDLSNSEIKEENVAIT